MPYVITGDPRGFKRLTLLELAEFGLDRKQCTSPDMWIHQNHFRSHWPHPRHIQHQKKRGKTGKTRGRNTCDQLVHRAGKGRGNIPEGRCWAGRLSSGRCSETLDPLSHVCHPALFSTTHTIRPGDSFVCLFVLFWSKVYLFWIGLCACFAEGRPGLGLDHHMSAPQGACSGRQDFENSNHLLIPSCLHLPGLDQSLRSSLGVSCPAVALVPVLDLSDSQILHLSCWLSL